MKTTWSRGCLGLAALTLWMLPTALARSDGAAGAAAMQLDDDDGSQLGGDKQLEEPQAASGTIDEQPGNAAMAGDEAADDALDDGQLLTGNDEEKRCDKHKQEGPSQALAVPGDDRDESEKLVDEEADPGGTAPES